MKKLSLLLFSGLLSLGLSAQQQMTPAPSPSSTIKQQVGLTDVKVEYSRPSARGRTIFGDLVPYGEVWRTGANENTKVHFSDAVTIGGTEVPAGTYALYTKPGETSWDVIFYSDTKNWGTPQNWDESKVAAKATVEAQKSPMKVETFTITLQNLHNNGADLGMAWEDVYVAVPIEVPTVKKAMKNIDNKLNGPSANDYYSAASYYLDEGKDLQKAKKWISKAVEMNSDAYWIMRKKALIHAELGETQQAIEAAKKSMEKAKKAGNMDYVRMNEKSLKEWGA